MPVDKREGAKGSVARGAGKAPEAKAARLRRAVPLFPRPSDELAAALAGYRQILEAVHPLKAKHRANLPQDVKRLSLALTAERGPGPQANYLAAPAALSAYLYYFLPWNLYRLARLFTGMDFDIPDGATVLDLGCGPLTLAQALWLSRPGLRSRRIRLVCVDQTGQAMRAGRALFEALAGEEGKAWTMELVQAPAHKAPMEPFDLVMAANAVNELARGRGEEGHEAQERLAGLLAGRLSAEGRLFLVEPGTRLGGMLLSRLRDILIEEGLFPLAPCTHAEACPMLAPRWRSWCHFVFPAEGAPEWLDRLTKLSGLDKDRASLSFLHMAARAPEYAPDRSRVVSHRFSLAEGQGVYACEGRGLRLFSFGQPPYGMVSGALVQAELPEPGERDPKSGAWLTPLAGGVGEEAQSAEQARAAQTPPPPRPRGKQGGRKAPPRAGQEVGAERAAGPEAETPEPEKRKARPRPGKPGTGRKAPPRAQRTGTGDHPAPSRAGKTEEDRKAQPRAGRVRSRKGKS